jgi:hypothetical protein
MREWSLRAELRTASLNPGSIQLSLIASGIIVASIERPEV